MRTKNSALARRDQWARWRRPAAATLLALGCALPAMAQDAPSERHLRLLATNCLQCHARPGVGAPLMGNPADWQTRVRQGETALLKNVVDGLRGMPPAGYCSACDEADLRVLTRLVAGLDGGKP